MFKSVVFCGLLVLTAAPAFASAQSTRLTDVAYLRLARCAAYNAAPDLATDRAAAFAEQAKSQARGRSPIISQKATDEGEAIGRSVRKVKDEAGIMGLKAKRDEACAGF